MFDLFRYAFMQKDAVTGRVLQNNAELCQLVDFATETFDWLAQRMARTMHRFLTFNRRKEDA